MFVATADRNYVLARTAYFTSSSVDFLWLSLHALEKYFKATLLLNGCSSKGFSHNLTRLHKAVCQIDSRLSFGSLIDPGFQEITWTDISVDEFLKWLNQSGSASNRYMTYGYAVQLGDLLKIDQIIWSVRRHCRPLKNGRDWIDVLQRSPRYWKLSGSLPLEQAIKGHRSVSAREDLLNLNKPFAPKHKHVLRGNLLAGANSPIVTMFEKLNTGNDEERKVAADVISWVIDKIELGADEKNVKNELAIYQTPAP